MQALAFRLCIAKAYFYGTTKNVYKFVYNPVDNVHGWVYNLTRTLNSVQYTNSKGDYNHMNKRNLLAQFETRLHNSITAFELDLLSYKATRKELDDITKSFCEMVATMSIYALATDDEAHELADNALLRFDECLNELFTIQLARLCNAIELDQD